MEQKVLVVDDTRVSAELAQAMLSHVGVKAEIAYSGEQALAWLADNRAALILSDWRMPDMDGKQLAQAVRQQFAEAQRPWLIAYSAYAEEDERRAMLNAGFDEVLHKPVRPDHLARTVKSWLARSRSS